MPEGMGVRKRLGSHRCCRGEAAGLEEHIVGTRARRRAGGNEGAEPDWTRRSCLCARSWLRQARDVSVWEDVDVG